ncbi:protein phosphatase 1 regulatory subunit 16A isoform X2 [Lepeophtheirus salmonis]|uniref:MYPT75D CG6896PAlike [Tribolium castaneum] n=1 Tax=Lepeophtheirus salmonis TaxID=72036 RepID=A0A0K2U5N5_LEPSM|nr:protein phosphatase 1 regulatory inhibitor subunit 16B-like isoform X2 [Lepeophtheirus salmonis]
MDHEALISEMDKLEHMPSQARLRLAKKRRMSQIRQWAIREKSGENSVAQKRSDIKVKFPSSVTLLEASSRNDVNEVYNMLKRGVSPDSANEDGLTALHQCCIDDNEEMLELLLENGANVNAKDTELWTPLHAAATCGHLHLVKYLIDRDADLLAVNADGNMPYDLCEDDITLSYIENEMAKRNITQAMIDDRRRETELRMLEDLKQNGNLEKRNSQAITPLHISAANGYSMVMEYLLDNDVSVDVVDTDLWQPIHAAACWGHLEAVELLAQNGANINALTKNGEKPCELTEDEDIKQYLIHLHEQRLKQQTESGPIVKRNKSVSSRSQSIRRSSLREKMRTTKKDAQDEKMYLIKTYDTPWASYSRSQEKNTQETEDYSSRDDVNNVEFDISSSNILDNVTKNLQENEGLRTSINGISSPVNIHVSVTINTNQQQSTCATSGTLSDLKKQRSLNRVQQQQQSYNKNSPIKEINQPLALKSNNNLNLVSNNLNKDNLEDKNPASKRFSDSEEVVGERSSSFLSSCCMIS